MQSFLRAAPPPCPGLRHPTIEKMPSCRTPRRGLPQSEWTDRLPPPPPGRGSAPPATPTCAGTPPCPRVLPAGRTSPRSSAPSRTASSTRAGALLYPDDTHDSSCVRTANCSSAASASAYVRGDRLRSAPSGGSRATAAAVSEFAVNGPATRRWVWPLHRATPQHVSPHRRSRTAARCPNRSLPACPTGAPEASLIASGGQRLSTTAIAVPRSRAV